MTLQRKLQKKMLDEELPYNMIPPGDLPRYHEAECKEWKDWKKQKSSKIIDLEGTEKGCRVTFARCIHRFSCLYHDKNASIRKPQI